MVHEFNQADAAPEGIKRDYLALLARLGRTDLDRARLVAMVGNLSEAQQLVLQLRFGDELPFDAVVAVLSQAKAWNEREVHAQLSSALNTLRAELAQSKEN